MSLIRRRMAPRSTRQTGSQRKLGGNARSFLSRYIIQDECDRLTAVAMKLTLGRQVVSTLPVKHNILLLQHLHEPPSPVSTARPMRLTSGRISHEAVCAGRP